MEKTYQINRKGWIGIAIVALCIIVIIVMFGRFYSQKSALKEEVALNKNTIVSNIPPNKQNEVKNGPAKKIQESLKNKAAEENATPVVQTIAETSWSNDLKGLFSEYGVQLMALIVSVFGVVLALSGFTFSSKKKQKFLKKYFHEIDDVYGSYKLKGKRCEAELYRLQDLIEHELKEGKMDENTFQLLEKRIEKYLEEIKNSDKV